MMMLAGKMGVLLDGDMYLAADGVWHMSESKLGSMKLLCCIGILILSR